MTRVPTGRRRAFSLVELLVVLMIITMVLLMAMPSLVGMLRASSIDATSSMLQSAVTFARSNAVSSNKSSSLDLAYSGDGMVTDRFLVSSSIVSEDFERFPTDPAELTTYLQLTPLWSSHPKFGGDGWTIVSDHSRELRGGFAAGGAENHYAWSTYANSPTRAEANEVLTALARFRVARPGSGARSESEGWGFGVASNILRDGRQSFCYRVSVQAIQDTAGYSELSRVSIEKVYTPFYRNKEEIIPAVPDVPRFVRTIDIPHETALVTSNIWYWVKMQVRQENGLVQIVGKVWVGEAANEPIEWTVGPAYDSFHPGALPPGVFEDTFREEPLLGGHMGVWIHGAEISVDDFSVESQRGWTLPKHVLVHPVRELKDVNDPTFNPETDLEVLPMFTSGSFPLTFLPEGIIVDDRSVLVRIIDTSTNDRKILGIDSSGRFSGR